MKDLGGRKTILWDLGLLGGVSDVLTHGKCVWVIK